MEIKQGQLLIQTWPTLYTTHNIGEISFPSKTFEKDILIFIYKIGNSFSLYSIKYNKIFKYQLGVYNINDWFDLL